MAQLSVLKIDNLMVWCMVAMAFWIALLLFYRLYLHPLAKYPGPWLAKVSDLYNVYHCYIGDRHLEFHRIHEKYGCMVRYGPNRLSINTSTALQAIYHPQANTRKSSLFSVFPRFFHAWSTQTMIDSIKFHHKAKRKTLNYALSDKALVQLEGKTLPVIRQFCAIIAEEQSSGKNRDSTVEKGWSSPRDMGKLTSYLSFDIMGQICFGNDFRILSDEHNRYILRVAIDGARCLNTVGHMQALLHTGIHKIIFRDLLKGLHAYQSFSSGLCERHLIEKGRCDSDSVFSHICSARHPEYENAPLYTDEELRCESSLLILAGSDTTSTCMAATLFYLLSNPPILMRAQDEIRKTFTDIEEIRGGAKLNSCIYLRACIDESLRMSPPVGGLMPREVLSGGMTIDDHYFPEGTEVGTPIYAIHHKEQYYRDAFTYNPSRWIIHDTDECSIAQQQQEERTRQLQQAKSAFCAWSVGTRSCVGRGMAYLEMSIVLGRLIWGYDMRLSGGGTDLGGGNPRMGAGRQRADEYQLWDAFASSNHGPVVEFRPRDSSALR